MVLLRRSFNHTLKLAVKNAQDINRSRNELQSFLKSLHSLHSQSPKNAQELKECARDLHITRGGSSGGSSKTQHWHKMKSKIKK